VVLVGCGASLLRVFGNGVDKTVMVLLGETVMVLFGETVVLVLVLFGNRVTTPSCDGSADIGIDFG